MEDIEVHVHRLVAGGKVETTFLDMKGVLSLEFHLRTEPKAKIKITEGRLGRHSLNITTVDGDIKIFPQANNAIVIEHLP